MRVVKCLAFWKKGTPKGGVIGGAGSKATTGKVTVFQVSTSSSNPPLSRRFSSCLSFGQTRNRPNANDRTFGRYGQQEADDGSAATALVAAAAMMMVTKLSWLLGKNLLMLGVHWILLTFSTSTQKAFEKLLKNP